MAVLPEKRLDAPTTATNDAIVYFGSFTVMIEGWLKKTTVLSVYMSKCDNGAFFFRTRVGQGELSYCIQLLFLRWVAPLSIINKTGTNFSGAEREIAEYFEAWNKEIIEEHLIQLQDRWKYNPPVAPHVGWKWEQLVMKYDKYCIECLATEQSDIEQKTAKSSQFLC